MLRQDGCSFEFTDIYLRWRASSFFGLLHVECNTRNYNQPSNSYPSLCCLLLTPHLLKGKCPGKLFIFVHLSMQAFVPFWLVSTKYIFVYHAVQCIGTHLWIFIVKIYCRKPLVIAWVRNCPFPLPKKKGEDDYTLKWHKQLIIDQNGEIFHW